MNLGYGISAAAPSTQPAEQAPARYLVCIDSGGSRVARLFLASHVQVAEFDAGAAEAVQISSALLAEHSAHLPEWDQALAGHSEAERRGAEVYTLQV